MKGVVLSVGLLAAVIAFVHPTRVLRGWGEHLDPFRNPAVFSQQADAICADYERSASFLSQPAVNANDWEATATFAARFLTVAQREVAKLHALPLPTTDRALAQQWIATHDRIVALLRRLPDAAQREDTVAVLTVIADLNTTTQRENQLARMLGMRNCSTL